MLEFYLSILVGVAIGRLPSYQGYQAHTALGSIHGIQTWPPINPGEPHGIPAAGARQLPSEMGQE